MGFYDAIVIINEFLMITLVLHVIFYREFNRIQKSWFIATFLSVMFCNAAEFVVHSGFYSPAFKIPLTILTVLQFSLAPAMAMLFAVLYQSLSKIASCTPRLNITQTKISIINLISMFIPP